MSETYPSTSTIAGLQAAAKSGSWRAKILARLDQVPSALFEVAAHFEVPDHVISGRFTELARDGYIERTGERRNKPVSECPAEVWRVRRSEGKPPELADVLGYPPTLMIEGEPYDRQELLPSESYPGIPYSRRADTGGLRLVVRLALVECPECGKPLFFQEKGKFWCGKCGQTWHARNVTEPGRDPVLAIVLKT